MDLPTYTNIWRIEKRLYKLYDFNLPMPLPIVQVGVFVGIFVFWVIFLRLVQVPFQPPWHVLYLVPPGLATYFVTRPVLEGKRLPELMLSQLRYLSEPRTWCRLNPVYEPERVTITATVWQRFRHAPIAPSRHARSRVRRPRPKRHTRMDRVPPLFRSDGPRAIAAPASAESPGQAPRNVIEGQPDAPVRQDAVPADAPVRADAPLRQDASVQPHTPVRLAISAPSPTAGSQDHALRANGSAPTAPPRTNGAGGAAQHLATPADSRDGTSRWRRITRTITGTPLRHHGHSRADDETRVVTPFEGTGRIAVLGVASGAGQTTTALMLGHSLARYRRDRCVALDVNPGRGSLARRSRMESPETLSSLLDRIDSVSGYRSLRAYTSQAGSGLEVIACDEDAAILTSFERRDFTALTAVLDRYYKTSVFDPAIPIAPHLLPLADQLVLVAPAAREAAAAVDSAFEWLRQHGHGELASAAVLAVTGVRKGDAGEPPDATGAADGCRDVVHIPWDERLGANSRGLADLEGMHQATRDAYLRLAATVADGFSCGSDRFRQEVSR